jgi:hypothetical protein
MAVASSQLTDPYELVSIRAVKAPSGAAGALWHRYEITQGVNKIVGYREGAIESVSLAVEAIVVRLNERRLHQRGPVHIVLKAKSTPANGA